MWLTGVSEPLSQSMGNRHRGREAACSMSGIASAKRLVACLILLQGHGFILSISNGRQNLEGLAGIFVLQNLECFGIDQSRILIVRDLWDFQVSQRAWPAFCPDRHSGRSTFRPSTNDATPAAAARRRITAKAAFTAEDILLPIQLLMTNSFASEPATWCCPVVPLFNMEESRCGLFSTRYHLSDMSLACI